MSHLYIRRSAFGASARGSSGRDDVEGGTEACSLDVIRPRRVILRRMRAKVDTLVLRPPPVSFFVDALEPGAYTRPLFSST